MITAQTRRQQWRYGYLYAPPEIKFYWIPLDLTNCTISSSCEILQTSPTGDLTDCGGVEPMVILIGRDRGAGGVINNLLMFIGNNQGIGSLMSSGP